MMQRRNSETLRSRLMSSLGMGLLLLTGPFHVSGQESLETQMLRVPEACQFDPYEMTRRGNQLLRSGLAQGNCDTIMFAEYHLLQAAVVNQEPRTDLLELRCPDPPGFLLYVHAANAHLLDRFDIAAPSFLKAESLSHTPKAKFNALLAAGCVYQDWGKHQEAYATWKKALENHPDLASSVPSLLNLSTAAIYAHEYEDALKWCDLATEAHQASLTIPSAPPAEPLAIQIENNRLLACILLQKEEEADAAFKRIKAQVDERNVSTEIIATLIGYMQWKDDFQQFEAMASKLNAWCLQDSAASVDALGAMVTLFEPWRTAVWNQPLNEALWRELASLPDVLQLIQAPETLRPAIAKANTLGSQWASHPSLWMSLAWATAILLGRYTLRQRAMFQTTRLARTVPQASPLQWSAWVDRGQRADAKPLEVLRAQWSALQLLNLRLQPTRFHRLPGFHQLNSREQAFLQHLAQGLRSKDFARLHGLSNGYVYNLSSSVRTKLQVPENQDLSQWLRAQSSDR